MKRTSSLLIGVLSAALLLLPAGPARAQSNARPPTQLTYQGFLTDANGVPFGNTAPVNKTVIFRIYDALTGGTLKWSSQQVVTVDKGYFSVLLGQGSAGPEGSSLFNADLTGVFTGAGVSDRYLELNADGTTIAPRLRFLPAPYAMLAKSATELLDPVTGASALSVSGGGVSGSGASLTSLNASQITSGTLNNARTTATSANTANAIVARDASGNFSANIGTFGSAKVGLVTEGFFSDGQNIALRAIAGGSTYFQNSGGARTDMSIANNGNVGIGTASPGSRLHVSGGDIQMSGGSFYMDNAKIFYAKNTAGTHEPFLWPRWNDNIFYLNYGSGGFNVRNNNGTSAMFMTSSGNVGIGTTSPTATLQVNTTTSHPTPGIALVGSGADMMMSLQNTSAGGRNWSIISAGTGSGVSGALRFYDTTGAADRMVINSNGNVGIGTTTPTQAKLSVSGGPSITGIYGPYINSGGYGSPVSHGAHTMSIYASGGIQTGDFFVASSDERIKTVLRRSDSSQDLNALLGIEVTDYRMKDVIRQGNATRKKVIAQQVEKVFPQAVSKSTDVVPDIYQKATVNDGWVQLTTNLKPGERVRLIGEMKEGIHEVLEVAEGRFRTDFAAESDQVFVYGREVKDFRSVDYDAIAMLNLSATQELAKQVESLRKSEARIAELEQKVSKLAGLEGELAEMKKLLTRLAEARTGGGPAAEVVTSAVKAGTVR